MMKKTSAKQYQIMLFQVQKNYADSIVLPNHSIFLQMNSHRLLDRQLSTRIRLILPFASNRADQIIVAALRGLKMIYREGHIFRRAGVLVMDLVPENTTQTNLFFDSNDATKNALMQRVDNVNAVFGENTVFLLSRV